MKSVVFFNNKGGVGKTTLICNVAANFATRFNKKVLLIDCDPQCNSTQLVLNDEICAELYWNRQPSSRHTLLNVLKPIEVGDAGIDPMFHPVPSTNNRFGIDLLPGHPRLSLVEDRLGQAWSEATGGQIGGLRKTNWCTSLAHSLQGKYDVVFFDVGPSLGSLNRSVLLGADYFVSPMGCDIFSIVGIRNIAEWLKQWLILYESGVKLCETQHPGAIEQFPIAISAKIRQGFAGYTVQQYITKSKQGVRRPTVAFEKILDDIPREMISNLLGFAAQGVDEGKAKLGDVPNMFSLIPLAQTAKAPILGLSSNDGLVGSQFLQAKSYSALMEQVTDSLGKNIGIL